MTVEEIIKQVRWCIDEESNNTSLIIDEKDDQYMDNIIKAKIPDALHWIAITATSSAALSSSSSTSTNDDKTNGKTETTSASTTTANTTTTSISVSNFENRTDIGVLTMPENISVFNINRVRGYGWHKAVVPVEDTDDEALMMFDDTAMGTNERPRAAIMRVTPLQILVQPIPTNQQVTVSYVGIPTGITSGTGETGDKVDITDTFESAFIYYLAFLLLSAYDDSKANQMYTIAVQQLGGSNK